MLTELKNKNLIPDGNLNRIEHPYEVYYARVNSGGITSGKCKQIDDNIEIKFDLVTKEIISIKVIK